MARNLTAHRIPNWHNQLEAIYRDRLNDSFEWGGHDCTRAAADVIKAITAKDVMRSYRSKYNDKATGVALLRELGGFEKAVSGVLDRYFLRVHPRRAGAGDVFLLEYNGLKTLGFVWFDGSALVADDGWIKINKDHIKTAWRVG